MTTLTVGPGQQFRTIADAVAASGSGDTIDVQSGTYTNDFFYIGHSLTLQAVGGEAFIVATQPGLFGKAAIVEGVPGANVVINGFDISGVAVRDDNGAAIRYEGGSLSLSNDYFHDNQEGLLGAADPNGSISIDHSEFARNGFSDGHAHNLYVGAIASLSVTNSYFHDAIVGHEIKSRAADNTITGNRIFDNQGSASYSVDLPNGGNVQIQNNVIQQGQNTQNPYIIAYAEEGRSNPGTNVSISGNTIVNDLHNGNEAAVFNATSQALPFTNNSVFGLTALQLSFTGPLADSGTVFLSSRPSLDTSSLSFIYPTPTPTPTPVTTGTGSDTLVLSMSEDAYLGDAQFTVAVDGRQLGGTFTATALHSGGASQDFIFKGDWAPGAHTVAVDFLNDAWAGTPTTDRNLYMNGLNYDGIATGQTAALMSAGTRNFAVTDNTTVAGFTT
jgi:hypothetical protein